MDFQKLIKTFLDDRNYKVKNKKKQLYTDPNGKRIQLFDGRNYKIDTNTLQHIVSDFLDHKVDKGIVIYRVTKITERKLISFRILIDMDILSEKELLFMQVKNDLIPTHTPLNDIESAQFIERYGKYNLPQLRIQDPVSRYYDFKLNQIIEIDRDGFRTYRVVVD